MRPEDLARELTIDGKRLRGWLRNRWPRSVAEHGLPWDLTPEQVAEVRRAFAGTQRRTPRPVVLRQAAPTLMRPAPMPVPPASMRLSWPDLQRHADAILASGLKDLTLQPLAAWDAVRLGGAGAYLLSDGPLTLYVGESTAVTLRVAQHRDPGSRFLADFGAGRAEDPLAHPSRQVRVRALPVEIGRLELEEFGIACLQPSLNRMRRFSRTAVGYHDAGTDVWRAVQADAGRVLQEGVEIALEMPSVPWKDMRPPSGPGVYILRDARGKPLYVGESDALGERLRTHAGSRSYFSALRRHVGTELLGFAFAPNVNRGFSPNDESAISVYLASCTIAIGPLEFGRWELERELVHELRPRLNREHSI